MTEVQTRALPTHCVSDIVGLNVVVINAAREVTDGDGETTVEVPESAALASTAAVARCLLPVRLKGSELRAIRKIAGWKASDLAAKLGEKTAPETVSRWENEKQPMSGYAEKVFRLVVCEDLCEGVLGIAYQAKQIADMSLVDPWRADPNYMVPPIMLKRVKIKTEDRELVAAYALLPVLKGRPGWLEDGRDRGGGVQRASRLGGRHVDARRSRAGRGFRVRPGAD